MNIFLQGIPGVGKSTIIKKVITELGISPSGFYTLSGDKAEGRQKNVYLHSVSGDYRVETSENLIGERYGIDGIRPHRETFDNKGVEVLNKVAAPLIIMDEIGFLENEAALFQRKVLELLEGSIPILGVIKSKTTPFIEVIIRNEKSVIIKVDEINRNEVYKIVLESIKKRLTSP